MTVFENITSSARILLEFLFFAQFLHPDANDQRKFRLYVMTVLPLAIKLLLNL